MFLVNFFILDYRKINLTNCFIKMKTCVDTYGNSGGNRVRATGSGQGNRVRSRLIAFFGTGK